VRAPIALVTLVDENRQWFKAAVGLRLRSTPRGHSLCARAIAAPEPRLMVVPDARLDAASATTRSSPASRTSASTPARRSSRPTGTRWARCA
jgi:GAF domain-containing protein